MDGADHTTTLTDYRWIIEEDRTFFVDPKCTQNPLPAGCPTVTSQGAPAVFGTNFHTSYMPLVATGCTGPLSCEGGQTQQRCQRSLRPGQWRLPADRDRKRIYAGRS